MATPGSRVRFGSFAFAIHNTSIALAKHSGVRVRTESVHTHAQRGRPAPCSLWVTVQPRAHQELFATKVSRLSALKYGGSAVAVAKLESR
jgi:hypothetical protein